MSSAPTPEDIAQSATWLAQALDPTAGLVRLVAMNRDSYRSASFLDDRLMQQPVEAHLIGWPELEAAMSEDLRDDARWIFHIGHVGSTLLSRLLGEIDGVLAIREPRLLRDLAVSPVDIRRRYLRVTTKLMSRTFKTDETACVKATSFASEILPQLVPASQRALCMYARPRSYIAAILAGENSVKELHLLETYRNERLARRKVELPPARNDADRAARAWACEMVTLESAAAAMTDRSVAWIDFDTMLQDMNSELLRIAEFFGFATDENTIAAITAGPTINRYSKDQSYEYSPRLREQLIDQELNIQGSEIEAALATIVAAADGSPLLAQALRRAED
jgi:hypothetical protein